MVSQHVSLPASPQQRRIKVSQIVIALLMVIVGVVVFFPIYWMVLSTIQPLKYSFEYSPSLFLRGLDLAPLYNVFLPAQGIELDMGLWLWNSTQLALMVTILCFVLSLP